MNKCIPCIVLNLFARRAGFWEIIAPSVCRRFVTRRGNGICGLNWIPNNLKARPMDRVIFWGNGCDRFKYTRKKGSTWEKFFVIDRVVGAILLICAYDDKKNVKNLNKNATFKTTKNHEFRRKPNAWKQTNCHATLEQYFFQEMNLMPIIIQLGKTMKVTKYINRIIHIIRACWLFFPTPSPICCWISMINSN